MFEAFSSPALTGAFPSFKQEALCASFSFTKNHPLRNSEESLPARVRAKNKAVFPWFLRGWTTIERYFEILLGPLYPAYVNSKRLDSSLVSSLDAEAKLGEAQRPGSLTPEN